MIKLYDYELSACCYKVRLLLGFLRIPFERIELDVHPGREHLSAKFRAINPLGTLPVIDDAGFVLRESQAILMYLAQRYDPTKLWCPQESAQQLARTVMWLNFAEGLARTAGTARQHDTVFQAADVDKCRAEAHRLLRVLDEHLWFTEQAGEQWLCSGSHHPTIADLACFPDVILSEEGGISRLPYPAIRRWTDRLRRLPDFTAMAGVLTAHVPAD